MKHDWNSISNYLDVHESVIRKYHPRMQKLMYYSYDRPLENRFRLRCEQIIITSYNLRKIRVDIVKNAETKFTSRGEEVRTIYYKYSAILPGQHNLFRYCAPHQDHRNFHHKHSWITGKEVITRVEDDKWPHVGEFFEEVLLL